jgi:hypothetical protein
MKPNLAPAPKPAALSARAAAEALMRAALRNTAYVLKPFPAGLDPHACEAAVAKMREAGLAHGPAWSPNLTPAGVDAARELPKA